MDKRKGRKLIASSRPEKYRNNLCLFFDLFVPFAKPFDSSGAVDEFLFSGIERMTLVADIYVPAFDGRFRLNDVSAGTGELCGFVLRMNLVSHDASF